MTYQHGKNRASLEAIRLRQEAAKAEALQAEAELAALEQAEKDLARTLRRRDKALVELLKVRDKFNAEAESAEADLELMRQTRRAIASDAKKAAAAAGKLERELAKAEEAELDLRLLQRERNRTATSLRGKNESAIATIHQLTRELPEPIYGGPAGLAAAVREASTHDASKREAAA